jgi:hypothetical protein
MGRQRVDQLGGILLDAMVRKMVLVCAPVT